MSEATVEKAPGRIAVGGEMTIYAAAELKDELFPLVQAADQRLTIDLSGVTALDTAGLQLLIMLKRIAKQSGIGCEMVKPSHAVLDVLNLCGLDALLAP